MNLGPNEEQSKGRHSIDEIIKISDALSNNMRIKILHLLNQKPWNSV